MSRYIDADELLNALQGQVSEVCNKIPYDKEVFTILHDRQMEIYNLIEKQPTADVVEVVRCKDCRFNVANMEVDPLDITDYSDITCSYFMTDGMTADDFCSYGKKVE